ncbi:GntR family transcriptional regulator [Xanthobacter oligotrophicus]|uniref:GntR family transcriptional regulator n=1 Tax=Xanthobacter oligotrophicus TaxID=2607286 RepID=A0ABW6ZVL1_9HYPH
MSKRYAEVARQLVGEIGQGVHPVGSTLPSEPALALALGVSRSTVRAALDELQKLGMVSRRPSLGTRVEAAEPQRAGQGFSQTLGSVEAISQYAADTRREGLTLADMVADREKAKRLGLQPGSRWLRISYCRVDRKDPEAPPICWTDVYVDAQYADHVRARMATHVGAVSELVEEAAGRRIAEVEQTLRASGVPERMAAALQAPVNDHALEITRSYFLGAGELALLSVSIHPGDRFAYVSRLVRAE